ncbi:hypothetical protein [Mammaliicoccus sciuri]|uniref:hypothetical protein n=1 Tax=Mammaliicoccus sciuri TaxID=1296 RepID=UPI000D1FB4DB|nr:hypothetical protein [Mammaliicoccus sciuri]PTK09045.1 hypothetical protein BU001_09485 [Mammaliicoccus sciuri]
MEYKIGNKVEIEEDGGKGGGFWTDARELSVQKREIWTDKNNYRSRNGKYGPIKIITGPEMRNMDR